MRYAILFVIFSTTVALADDAAQIKTCQFGIKAQVPEPASVQFGTAVVEKDRKPYSLVYQCAHSKNIFGTDVLNLWACRLKQLKDGSFVNVDVSAGPHKGLCGE